MQRKSGLYVGLIGTTGLLFTFYIASSDSDSLLAMIASFLIYLSFLLGIFVAYVEYSDREDKSGKDSLKYRVTSNLLYATFLLYFIFGGFGYFLGAVFDLLLGRDYCNLLEVDWATSLRIFASPGYLSRKDYATLLYPACGLVSYFLAVWCGIKSYTVQDETEPTSLFKFSVVALFVGFWYLFCYFTR